MKRRHLLPVHVALLEVRVHAEAFWAKPLHYLQAVGWRLRGLKVRSRHRLAALKGSGAHAYALWMAREDRYRSGMLSNSSDPVTVPLHVVIDCRATMEGLDATLSSIANGSALPRSVWLLGCSEQRDFGRAIGATFELAEMLRHDTKRPPWVLSLAPSDLLHREAIAVYGSAITDHPDARLLYADDDLVDERGIRHAPHFKPTWNEELAKHHDFLSGSCVFACEPDRIDHAWPSGVVEHGAQPHRIARVLHHRRQRPLPVVPSRNLPDKGDLPHVSVIVPTRDQLDLLKTCIDGLRRADYPSFDLTVIDNDSRDPAALAYLDQLAAEGATILRHPGAFNYADMHNRAVPSARGPVLCLLNNDIEMIDHQWLKALVAHAVKPGVGAVGAKLLYPDGTIQHAGIITGLGGGAGHAHRFQRDDDPGYFSRAHLPQYVSAVTAACLVIEAAKFEAVGGFDAEHFPVAFNDVDLCLKLNAAGWQTLYEPRAVLIHHESKSRGQDDTLIKRERFAGELSALKRLWRTDARTDQFHHPELSPMCEQFVVRL